MKVFLFVALTIVSAPLYADDALQETRYCGTVTRDALGRITRRADVLAAFKNFHPCPTSGATHGACPGWDIDHVIPRACGGCDAVSNLQWLPDDLKSAPVVGKDRFERYIYCRPFRIAPRRVAEPDKSSAVETEKQIEKEEQNE